MNNTTKYIGFEGLGNWSTLIPAKKFFYPGDHGVIPTIIFVGTLAVVGFLGNLHVLLISFIKYTSRNTYITYIRALAIIDFLACAIHVPLELMDLYYPYDLFSSWSCKLFRFDNAFLFLSSSFILLAIAIDRYRHVCHPFRIQRTVSLARKFIALCIISALVFSSPLFAIYGLHKVEIDFDVFAEECYIQDNFQGTVYPIIYISVLYSLFVIIAIILIYTYASIGITMHRQEKRRVQLVRDICDCHFKTDCMRSHDAKHTSRISIVQDITDSNGSACSRVSSGVLRRRRQRKWVFRRFEVRKTTKILFVVTLIFILSYLPFVTLSCIVLKYPHFRKSLNEAEITIYDIAMRLTFLNNVSNPFVYGIFDDRYKIASRDFLLDLIRCLTRRRRTKVANYKH
ncbi:hypothetical protein FSP39_020358 [Pinctada imbricata]|uniref:G-protein coupled receptors family 1 profile domain-containing protein n=1 Tax=Pinctada imbricata TaxID=66713 RepID=A0AA88YEP3_PINIB|nr:hypothetical protein FSP39_020358 [Pinctada imbricata]